MQISIITATRPGGRTEFLDEVWESICALTMPCGWKWEWVLQEDGAAPTLRDWAGRDTRIRYDWNGVHEGAAGTRNLALGRATGTWFRNLDDDDLIPPGALAAAIDAISTHPSVVYVTGPALDLVDDDLISFDHVLPPGFIAPMTLVDHWVSREFVNVVHPTALFARRDVVLALGGYMALPCSEDTGLLMTLGAICDGWQLQEPILYYRRHPGQTIAAPWVAELRGRDQRYRAILERVKAINHCQLHFRSNP